jgi:hypothetical protein
VRVASQIRSTATIATTTAVTNCRWATTISAVETPLTAPQKKLVAVGPSDRPPASAKLLSRQVSADHVSGSAHLSWTLGPVGAS